MTRRDLLWGGAVLGGCAGLAWLNQRPDADGLRIGVAIAVTALGLGVVWTGRSGLWRPPLAILATGVALIVLYITTPDTPALAFEPLAATALIVLCLSALAWLALRVVLPRDEANPAGVIALGGLLSALMLTATAALWLTAVDRVALHAVPVIDNGPALDAVWQQPWGARRQGIFLVGTLGGEGEVGRYNARRLGSSSTGTFATFLPTQLSLTLADGTPVQAQGIVNVAQALEWPHCADTAYARCLTGGDPVVLWGEPGRTTQHRSGEPSWALNATRAALHGRTDRLEPALLRPMAHSARAFGWVGLALMPVSLIPLALCLWRARALRRGASPDAAGNPAPTRPEPNPLAPKKRKATKGN